MRYQLMVYDIETLIEYPVLVRHDDIIYGLATCADSMRNLLAANFQDDNVEVVVEYWDDTELSGNIVVTANQKFFILVIDHVNVYHADRNIEFTGVMDGGI